MTGERKTAAIQMIGKDQVARKLGRSPPLVPFAMFFRLDNVWLLAVAVQAWTADDAEMAERMERYLFFQFR